MESIYDYDKVPLKAQPVYRASVLVVPGMSF